MAMRLTARHRSAPFISYLLVRCFSAVISKSASAAPPTAPSSRSSKPLARLWRAGSAVDERGVDYAGFVDLATAEDPALLASAVRAELGIVAETDEPMSDIEAFIGNRRMLVIFDSCERMVAAIAALIG